MASKPMNFGYGAAKAAAPAKKAAPMKSGKAGKAPPFGAPAAKKGGKAPPFAFGKK